MVGRSGSRQRQPAQDPFSVAALALLRVAKSFRQTAPSDFERAVSPSFHTDAKIADDASIGTRVHVSFVPLWRIDRGPLHCVATHAFPL